MVFLFFFAVSDAQNLPRLRNALAHNFTLVSVNVPEVDKLIAANRQLKDSSKLKEILTYTHSHI